ncbi:hypothetical protein [Bacillus infantis]|uniref:hypothetical protein n=1 Tax=Bacillus infantis TaxID=324767 RepID=UPI00209D0C4F|nr:hypothetical protein [Bacillus infantis]MCP1161375.1 hypothetical protein [Bacillus infantis]
MEPRFEPKNKCIIIEWMEHRKSESPTHHYFEVKPLSVQYHPKEKHKMVRAYFQSELPGWIKRYAEIHKFRVQSVNKDGITGWWLSRWGGFEENPFSSPTIKGAIRQLKKMIPDVCDDLKEKVNDNASIIEKNLMIDAVAFEPFGLYFSPELIVGKGGCMLLEKGVIPEKEDNQDDEEYRNIIEATGKLSELVWEITTPLPFNEEQDLELEENETEEELLITQLEDEEEIVLLDEFEDLEDLSVLDEELTLEPSEQFFEEDILDLDREITIEEDDFTEETHLNESSTSEPMNQEDEIENIEMELDSTSEPDEEQNIDPSSDEEIEEDLSKVEHRVLQQNDKKSKALAGQVALF